MKKHNSIQICPSKKWKKGAFFFRPKGYFWISLVCFFYIKNGT
jgi:hypothetical protein